jgi:hypothetical protein
LPPPNCRIDVIQAPGDVSFPNASMDDSFVSEPVVFAP